MRYAVDEFKPKEKVIRRNAVDIREKKIHRRGESSCRESKKHNGGKWIWRKIKIIALLPTQAIAETTATTVLSAPVVGDVVDDGEESRGEKEEGK